MKTSNWDLKKSTKSKPDESSQPDHARNIEIDNYYGAHKNFKTDFRNKKYRNVYSLLTHRRPSQPEYMSLYYQDLLIAIIKILQGSLFSKENRIDSIEPYFYFGTKAIGQFYWLFLKERRLIGRQLTINPTMKNKISNFLTLTIDFSSKIAQYLGTNGNRTNTQTIYKVCYENIVLSIINSSTSNVLLLKKCGQFLLHYATYCLKSDQVQLAHHLLKEGLLTQLNQLILLKSSFVRKKKQKKYLNRYCSTLKCLTNYYLVLAMLYQKKSKMYECATIVLDSVALQELICTIKKKTKKWICSLEESYIQQKNKCIQLRRICQIFFTPDFVSSVSENIRQNREKAANQTNLMSQSSKQDKIYFCTNSSTQDIKHREDQKLGKTNKAYLSKGLKEVRFQLNQESAQNIQSRNRDLRQFNKQKVQSQCISQCGKQILEPVASFNEFNSSSSVKGDYDENIDKSKQDCMKITKVKSKSLAPKREEQENNEFLLFGETFWKSNKIILTNKSKSTYVKANISQNYKSKRKNLEQSASYNNLSSFEFGLNRSKQENNQANCLKLFLKQNYHGNDMKKRVKKEHGVLFRKKNQNLDCYADVKSKMSAWHIKSQKIDNDVRYKIQRLQQKKNLKTGNQIAELAQSSSAESSLDENKCVEISQIQNKIRNVKKQQNKSKKSKKLSGVGLLKQFLIDNRTFFNISKLEIFNPNNEIQDDRRYNSFLTGDKVEDFDKLVERNHWQAKNNVNFFIDQIESSNKKLNQCKSFKHSQNAQKNKPSLFNQQYQLAQRLKSLENVPTKLFTTSLKTRACEMINYI